MTTIFSVFDASMPLAQQDPSRPPPAEDFAHELAKHPSPVKQSTQGDGKAATPQGEFAQEQTFGPMKAASASAPEESLPQLEMPLAMATQMDAAEPTVAPTGVTETLLEARVFGWHAMAQAYLSELTAADGQAKPSRASQGAQAFADPPPELGGGESASGAVVTPSVAEASNIAPQVEPLVKLQQSFTSDDARPVGSIEPAATDISASGFWPERSLRFTRQRDGSSVAWLRDFRLSDAEATHLIQVVLNDAKEKGVALSKVMLNGREVWTSPNVN
jgi:hypothetical protein